MEPALPPRTPERRDLQQGTDEAVPRDVSFLRGPQINIISASEVHNNKDSSLIQQYMSMIEQEYDLKPLNNDSASTKPGRYSTPISLKSQKKKYLKLFSTMSTHKSEDNEENSGPHELCTSIANEELSNLEREDMRFWEERTVRAGMGYFEEECGAEGEGEGEKRLDICIEQERRILLDAVVESEVLWQQEKEGKVKRRVGLSLSRRMAHQKALNPQVNETFRYCIGCLKSVLQVNIPNHERDCPKFQQVLSMNLPEFTTYLEELTKQVLLQLEQQSAALSEAYLASIQGHTTAFLKECELVCATGQPSEIYNFKFRQLLSKSEVMGDFIGCINRMNWFLRIRQKLKQREQ